MTDKIISPERGYNHKKKRYRKAVVRIAEKIVADLPERDRDRRILRAALDDPDKLGWRVAERAAEHARRDFLRYVASKMGITEDALLTSRPYRTFVTTQCTLHDHGYGHYALGAIAMTLDATKAEQPATPPPA